MLIGLTEPRGRSREEEARAQRLHEIGIRAAQLIYMVLMRTIESEQLRYELARMLYAQSDEKLEELAGRRGSLLGPYDVNIIVEAAEEVLRRSQESSW